MSWLLVFLGGGLGSLARYGLSLWLGAPGQGFPLATFLANVLACLVLGLVWSGFAAKGLDWESARLLMVVGFCGGFSTFSTFSLETLRLIQYGEWGMALLYVLGSLLAGLLLLAWIVRPVQ